MRIEILLGHDGHKTYYQIGRNELIIGSSNQCDVILPRPEISRRHLSLLVRGDKFFIIDHNSTNGTFINEEKIEPGQKIEWKTYIPIRLATGVIISLVEDAIDEDAIYQTPVVENPKNELTRTMVIPLAQLKASAKKNPTRTERKKKKKQGMGKAYLVVIVLIGVAYYLNVSKGVTLDTFKLKGKRAGLPEKTR